MWLTPAHLYVCSRGENRKVMEKQITINGKQHTINVADMYVTAAVRTGINVSGASYNYTLVCNNSAPVDNVEDLFADVASISMFANEARIPITDARLRAVKTLAPLAAKVSEDTPDAVLTAWDAQVENVFKGRKIPVKTLSVSVSELTNGQHDSYTLSWEIDGKLRTVENVTMRTVSYIDDDTAAYERLRKAVVTEIAKAEAAEEGGE